MPAARKTSPQFAPSVPELPSVLAYRFSVEQYHQMIEAGVFLVDGHAELLEELIVATLPLSPPHATANCLARKALGRRLPKGWFFRERCAITTKDSEPETDMAVVRDAPHAYYHAHPGPADIGLVVDVCEPHIRSNRLLKKRVCARARIPFFWLIDLEGFRVEVYSEPRGDKTASYRQRCDYRPGESVPLVLDDLEITRIPVRELLPKYLATVPLT